MNDLRDPTTAEQLAASEPDEYLRRREFLQRTAAAAGLATAAGLALPSETLIAEAARRQRRVKLPDPRNIPVDTIVVLMMENRSFDHYLGWLPNADGRQAGLTYTDKEGKEHATRPLAPDWQGCGHPDPNHSWDGGRVQVNGGKMDGFLRAGDNDEFAISYYKEGELGFIQDAAKAFTTYDRFFCSLLASTFPNREYMHAAQSYGMRDNTFPQLAGQGDGFPFETTIWAALAEKGVSHRYFFNDLPAAGLWGVQGMAISSRVEEYYARCQSGTLPNVCFVDPNFGASAGADEGVSADEHPHGDVRAGQAFMADVAHALMQSPQWPRAALFITYDEWGGFFDHVRPPRVPDQRNSRKVEDDYGYMGLRVPTVVLSPYARRGHVSHTVYGFESILKMITYKFGLRPLNRRLRYSNNIARSFDWESKPRLELPQLPDPVDVVSMPCATSGGESPPRPREHGFVELAESGYFERLGFHYEPTTTAGTFRQPDTITKALAR